MAMTPNYDRFLTRVFDKQEKEMIYPSGTGDLKSQVLIKNKYRTLRGVTATSLLVTYYCGITYYLTYIPFGDRFIPMQCYGEKDKNKKLIYDGDMVTGLYDDYELAEALYGHDADFKITNGLVKFENGCFSLYEIDCSDINDHEDFSCYMNMTKDVEIIGNKWEQPELWELKQ